MMAAATIMTKTAAEGAFYHVGRLQKRLPILLTFQRVSAYEGKKATKIRGYAVKARKRLYETKTHLVNGQSHRLGIRDIECCLRLPIAISFVRQPAFLRFYVLPPYFTRLRAFV